VLSALYFLVQIAVAWEFRGNPQHPMYNLVTNTISDLGNTSCGRYGSGIVCSPRWILMDVWFVVLGIGMAVGSLLLYHEFCDRDTPQRRAAMFGFILMGLGGVGAAIVGLFPENVNGIMHETGAALGIGAGNLGIFVIGAVVTLPEAMRRNMLLFSSTAVAALLLFAFHKPFGIGGGTMERVAAYPETLWMILFGLYVWRYHPKKSYAQGTAHLG
jgi:hypothetical membrane protein